MARVTLTIDDCEDGVKLTLESDPPFDMSDDGESTDAQMAGMIAMRAIQDAGSEGEDADAEIRCDDCRDLYGQCSGCALRARC